MNKNKKHILTIKFVGKKIDGYQGTFEFEEEKSTIKVFVNKEHKDTLIHELTHFVLALVTGKWYGHGKKFKKLYKVIKEL